MQFDPSTNNLDAYERSSPDLARVLQAKAQVGADFWSANSIKRTGHNARSVEARVEKDGDGRQIGIVHAYSHYARFREHGTRYNAPERVLAQAIAVIEGT